MPQVHRGVYEAAQLLYDRFLPLVQDHLASSPFAKVGAGWRLVGGLAGGQRSCVWRQGASFNRMGRWPQ